MKLTLENIKIYQSDIPVNILNELNTFPKIAWDIETTGLDWQFDRIATCQLYTEKNVHLVRINDETPKNLISLLKNNKILKIFHHAMFDLRFMSFYWRVKANNIACTKIASNILNSPPSEKNSLKNLLNYYLNIAISKDKQQSNWLNNTLEKDQLLYAAKDVIYLVELLNILEKELTRKKLLRLCRRCFKHIPTRVELEINKIKDPYIY